MYKALKYTLNMTVANKHDNEWNKNMFGMFENMFGMFENMFGMFEDMFGMFVFFKMLNLLIQLFFKYK